MQAQMNVTDCGTSASSQTVTGATRQFFVTANEVLWNYGPTGVDQITGNSLETDAYADLNLNVLIFNLIEELFFSY